MFWKKKLIVLGQEIIFGFEFFLSKGPKKPTVVKVVKINKLMMEMKDGTTLAWGDKDWKGTKRIEPWKGFYKWFFGRSGDIFVMRTAVAETMIRRSDIVRFEVSVHTSNQLNHEGGVSSTA